MPDLLKKGFCFGNHFALAYLSAKGDMTFQGKLRAPKDLKDTHSYAQIQAKAGEATFTLEMDSKNSYKAVVEVVPEDNKDLKLKGELTKNLKTNVTKGVLSLDHSLPDFRYKVSMIEGPVFKLNSVFGHEDLGFGFELGFDWMKSEVCTYDALLFLGKPTSRCVLKHVSHAEAGIKGGDWVLSAFREVSQRLAIAGKGTKTAKGQLSGEAGVKWDCSSTRSLTAKVNQDGVVSLGSRQQLWACASLLYSLSFSTAGGHVSPLAAGFKLKLNS